MATTAGGTGKLDREGDSRRFCNRRPSLQQVFITGYGVAQAPLRRFDDLPVLAVQSQETTGRCHTHKQVKHLTQVRG